MNMFNINVPAAVGTLLGGTIVLVLSIGLWTGNRYMQITRIAIYLCGLVVAALSFSVIGLANGISAVWPMPVILVLFSSCVVFHFYSFGYGNATKPRWSEQHCWRVAGP